MCPIAIQAGAAGNDVSVTVDAGGAVAVAVGGIVVGMRAAGTPHPASKKRTGKALIIGCSNF